VELFQWIEHLIDKQMEHFPADKDGGSSWQSGHGACVRRGQVVFAVGVMQWCFGRSGFRGVCVRMHW
jgi:hypothetical protein